MATKKSTPTRPDPKPIKLRSIRALLVENRQEQHNCYRKAVRLCASAKRLMARAQKPIGTRQKAALARRIAQLVDDGFYELGIASTLESMRRVLAGR